MSKDYKVAVVTGGTKGLGLGLVKALLSKGYYVYTNFSNNTEQANKAAQELNCINNNYTIIQADQSDKNSFKNFINTIRNNESSVNVIICNTGITCYKPSMNLTNDDWEKVMMVNVHSHFYLIRDLYNIIPNNSRILFMGSMMGKIPHSSALTYGVTKAAIHGLTKNLVKVFEGTGTTVNALAPGFIDTGWHDGKPSIFFERIYNKSAIKRFGTIEEVVNAAMFLIENPFTCGTILDINGGYSCK